VTVRPGPSDETLIGLNRLATVARLLSGAIHDVNNALMVISGTVDILESRPDVPASMHDSLARLRAQSARAAGTLGQVTLFTRSAHGEQQPVNLRELAQESLALRDFAIRRARSTATLETAGEGPFIVTGSRGDLQQVLLNLIMNAEDGLAGRTGSIRLRLSIEPDAERADVVMRVIDDGTGVSLVPREAAFDRFVTTHADWESAGLGLWAARTLVERHGGTLTMEESGMGTAFAMRLPLKVLR
jgi:signal transduction histidine kinase